MSETRSNPYKGPEFFTRKDAEFFFGRKQESRDLPALGATERLLLYYAPSGAGKTSLLNAKIIPNLEEKLFEVLPVGRVSGVADVPAEVENVYTFNLMRRLAQGDKQPERFIKLDLGHFLLHLSTTDGIQYFYDESEDALRLATSKENLWPRVLILDQFEEIITSYPTYWEHREDFFRQLDDALAADPLLRVVFCLRSDFVQELDRYAGLLKQGFRGRYHMLQMSKEDARLAIEGPASHPDFNRPFDEGVAAKLVQNLSMVRETDAAGNLRVVEGEWIEPIQLQVVCYQLWESLRETPGDRTTYEDLMRLARATLAAQGVSESKLLADEEQLLSSFVDGALGAFYERALDQSLKKAGKKVNPAFVRDWFSTKLITENGARGFLQRGKDETEGVPDSLVAALVDMHLLRSDARGGVRLIELVHDRFVEPVRRANAAWNERRMQDQPWIAAAYKWGQSGDTVETRDDSLLLKDDDLATARSQRAGQQFEALVEEFLAASEQAHQKRFNDARVTAAQKAMREERRRAQELSKLADEQQKRADAETKLRETESDLKDAAQATAGKMRRMNRWLIVAILIAGVMSGLAVWQAIHANQERTYAQSQTDLATYNARKARGSSVRAQLEKIKAGNASAIAEAALKINRSLTLASLSRSSSEIPDRLLLARAALSDTKTLPATAALLTALDAGYRGPDSRIAPFVPSERLDWASGGPWASMAFSTGGSMVAVGDTTGGIRLWDNATGEPIGGRLAMPGPYRVNSIAFDPTGPRFAAVTADRDDPTTTKHALILWDLRNPDALASTVLANDQASMWSVAFSPDGQLAVGNEDGTVNLWSLSGSDPISRTLPGRHADWAYSVAFDDEGKRLASAGKDGKIFLWSELSSREPVSQPLADHTAWVNDVAFSPDGARLASGSDDGTVRLWNLAEDPPTSVVIDDHSGEGIEAWDLAFSPGGGKLLAVGWGDGFVRVYDTERPDVAPWQLAGHNGEVSRVAFDPATPQRLVSLSTQDTEPITWDLNQRSEFATNQPFSHPITSTLQAISADGHRLATVGANRRVYLTDLGASSPPISFTVPMSITAVAFSGDGSQMALAGCEPVPTQAPSETPAAKPTAETPKAGLPQPAPTQKPGGPSSSGLATANCKLTLWSAGGEPPISPSRTITSAQPIIAVAFHPQAADDLVVGLDSGEVKTYNLATGTSANLLGDVPDLVDLAFSSDGGFLAALGTTGEVKIWNWSNGEIVNQTQSLESGSKFNTIDFVYGDAWLATASDRPQLELWERGTWKKVAPFDLDSGRSADLVAVGQTLISVQPEGLARWPMDQAAWLGLACTRAQRNLSYQAWRTAFPAEEGDDSALICPDFPLDVSFADTRIDEAKQAIDDCTPEQLAKGMNLLKEAVGMKVDPPLDLDPLDVALHVLSDQALDDLRQRSRSFDKHARACLQRAAVLAEAGQPAIDPTQAFTVGQYLVMAQDLLADPSQTDVGPAVDRLEYVLEHRGQWPVDLSSALSLLPQAYFQLCQQDDGESCKRLKEHGEFLEYDKEVNASFRTGQAAPLFFRGQEGDWVTIDLSSSEFDTTLKLQGPDGLERTNDDCCNSTNSQIEFVVPKDSVYLIQPSAYSDGEGAYRLFLKAGRLEDLSFNRPVTSTTQANTLWAFEGEQGQAISLNLETLALGSDPYLAVQQDDGTTQAESSTSEGGRNARIAAFILPAKGRYLVKTLRPDTPPSTAPYTLTLSTVMPSTIGVGQAVTSTTQSDPLWVFQGQAGQIVDIAMTTVDSNFDPYLTLYGARGIKLAENDDSGGTLDALIPTFVLTRTASYYVEAGRAGSSALYRLSLASSLPLTLTLDSSIPVTRSGAFRFSGQDDQLVALRTDPPADLALVGRGRLLVEHSPAILTRLDASSPYTAVVYLPVNAYSVTLSLDTVSGRVTQLAFNQPPAPGQMQATGPDVWSFLDAGAKGVEIAVKPAAGYLDLELYDPGGALITSADETNRLLSALPTAGTYLLTVRPGTAAVAGPYTIEIRPVDVEQGPQACQQGLVPDYGPVDVGSTVVLGRHRPVNGDASWDETMAQYVGRQAIVTSFAGVDGAGCPVVQVDIDNGYWFWRIRDMSILD